MKNLKNLIILIFILLFSNSIFSQQWLNLLPNKPEADLTFYDYQMAFNKYWEPYNVVKGYYINNNGEKQKAIGWKQFKRWEYYWEQRIDRETGKFPILNSRNLLQQYGVKSNKKTVLRNTIWTPLGPTSSTGGYAGIGRISCIAFHPTNNNIYWIGAASGGIWKTMDGGSSWTVLNEGTAVLGVSSIIIPDDYTTSHTIYIGTGDRDGWDNNSIGVLKSTDEGATWNTTGLSYAVANNKMINKLLIDPNDNQTILAATKDGVFKTTDGGTTWNTQLSSERFIDLEYKPGDFNTLYGGTRYGGEIWRSIDGGTNWSIIKNTDGERVELAVSSDDPNVVYALISASGDGLKGIYKSTNSGASFSLEYNSKNLLGWNSDGGDSGGQGWYDLSLTVNPNDVNMVFVGGVNTWKSTDGASTFSIVNHWSGNGAQAVHADKHRLKYRSNGDVFECNDGGVYISNDDGGTWTDKTNGMQISQIYKIGVAQTVNNDIITGLQDNGTKNHSSGIWDDVIGGDGMDCAIDFTDENIQYGELYYGDLKRTLNHWSSKTSIQPSGSAGAWVTPFTIDPNDHNTIIAGYQNIYKSTNQGNNWTNIYNLGSSGKFRTIDIAPSNSQYIYAGESYTLWKTTNGGSSWSDITSGLPANTFITDITVKDDNESVLWVTLSSYSGNTVYESTDAGNNWTNISSGLPNVPAHNIVQNKQNTTENELYVATDNGVYTRTGNNNWESFNSGLPNVEVRELEIYYDQNDNTNSLIRAGTYGRGLWESNLYEPIPPDPNQSKDLIFSNIRIDKITANWTNGTGDKRIVKINNSNSFTPPVDGTDPVPNSVYTGGEQVIFNGINGPVTVTNLNPSTIYYFRVYDYTGSGATTVYNKAPGVSNNPASQTTYCRPSSTQLDDDYIKRFVLNSIDNTSGETDYTDFTNISTALLPGQIYDVSVEVSGYDEYLSIWIDLNDNQQFESSEKLITDFVCPANSLSTTQISIPAGSSLGTHILRARIFYIAGADACEEVSYGEGEDYIVDFKNTFTWTGTTNNDWLIETNWDVGKIPTLSYNVIIPNTTNQPIVGVGQTANAKNVTLEPDAGLIIHGVLNIQNQ